jgi:NhaA family Na+:H+ antiporter
MSGADTAGGLVLLACAGIAIAWANSPWASSYDALWNGLLTLGQEPLRGRFTVRHAINDGLMAVFFFLVGLEIKRELLVGALTSARQAALPIAAAIGGMVVPALLYAVVNGGGTGARGWGIPMATDIAFALGVLALLGSRVPSSLRVFLSALAIADDLGAVLVIALFYTATVSWGAMAAAAGLLMLAVGANAAGVRAARAYIIIGLALWVAVLLSGVHATVAGVLLAFTIPSHTTLARMERGLHGIVTFGILPLFALANAGVSFHGGGELLTSPVAAGVLVGLFLGKPLGITLAAWGAVRSGIATLPAGVSWRTLHGVAWLGGIGFTMSLFIAGLAFGAQPALLTAAKLGVLLASVLAGSIGWTLLRGSTREAVVRP